MNDKPEVDWETPVSNEDLALLLGVDVAVLRSEIRRQNRRLHPGHFEPPAEWLRQGRRIANETMAAIGSEDITDGLEYLRMRAAERTNR